MYVNTVRTPPGGQWTHKRTPYITHTHMDTYIHTQSCQLKCSGAICCKKCNLVQVTGVFRSPGALTVELLVCAGGAGCTSRSQHFLPSSLQRKQRAERSSLPRAVIHFLHYYLIVNENSSYLTLLPGTVGSDYNLK